MRKSWKKPMALLLTTAMLTANVGMVIASASGEDKKEDTKTEDSASKADQVEAPKANPAEGSYEKSQEVTLTSATKDAVIYYTTDGKEPTVKSNKFDAKKPLEITKTTTVKAMAVKAGMKNSKVVSYTYKVKDEGLELTAEPTKEPVPTATATPEAELTKDPAEETDLTQTAQQEQAGSENETPKASDTPTVTPTSTPAETPGTLTPIEGTQTISLEASIGEALKDLSVKERFTTPSDFTVESAEWYVDETAPKASEELVLELAQMYHVDLTLKAAEGKKFGSTVEFTLNDSKGMIVTDESNTETECRYSFNILTPKEDPTILPMPGETLLPVGTTVELKHNNSTAVLWYKIGEAGEWKQYSPAEKIALTAGNGICTVYYKASENNIFTAQKMAEYKMDVKAEAPTANPKAGTYTKTQKVTLTTATEGAKIYYTTDGTAPTKDSTEYTKPISVSKDTTVKAVAYLANGQYSEVSEFKYEIELPPEPEIKQITNVHVMNLAKPQKGQKPDIKAKLSSSSHSVIESIEWTEQGKTDNYTQRFKAYTKYIVYVVLKAKNGYEYDMNIFPAAAVRNDNAKINASGSQVYKASKNRITLALIYTTNPAAKADSSKVSITGIASSYNKGATVNFTATGTTTVSGDATASNEGDERYVPSSYDITYNGKSVKSDSMTYDSQLVSKRALSFPSSGTYTLKVTFQKQVYDSNEGEWKNTEDKTEKTAYIKINSSSSGSSSTPTPSSRSNNDDDDDTDSKDKKSKGAKTGDETPIGALVGAMAAAGLAAGGILVVRKRRKDK